MKYNLHTTDPQKNLDHGCGLFTLQFGDTFNQGVANKFWWIVFRNFGSVATSNEA